MHLKLSVLSRSKLSKLKAKVETVEYSLTVPAKQGPFFDWHTRPALFNRLIPPWVNMRILKEPEILQAGNEAVFQIRKGPLLLNWKAGFGTYIEGQQFTDYVIKGPFKYWKHEHIIEALPNEQSRLIDRISYELPSFGFLLKRYVKQDLDRLFKFRHTITRMDLERYGPHQIGAGKTVLITGRTGLVGRAVEQLLVSLGYTVRGLSRRPNSAVDFLWDPPRGEIDSAAFDGVDSVIHLAGESIAQRWNSAARNRILASRAESTRLIVSEIVKRKEQIDSFVSISGINYYTAGRGLQDERSSKGDSFLGDVCEQWEREALVAEESGIRTLIFRTGVVLSPQGGALKKMLLPFKFGLGGTLGSGTQHMSWIALEDLCDLFAWALESPGTSGVINAVAPEPVTNKTYTKVLGKVLNRPTFLPIPSTIIKGVFGQMGKECLLADLPVTSHHLNSIQYKYRFPSLMEYLKYSLGKS